jgi:hypothetical protein
MSKYEEQCVTDSTVTNMSVNNVNKSKHESKRGTLIHHLVVKLHLTSENFVTYFQTNVILLWIFIQYV